VLLLGLLSSWSQSVRDKEFLVEMRLRNLEPEKERVKVEDEREEGQLEIGGELEADTSDNQM
jgi:E3 ubiquitin-protein ligase MARCH6